MKLAYSAILTFLFLTGCRVCKEYEPPVIDIPYEWHSPVTEQMKPPYQQCFLWWESLNDPILNSLIERAATQNLDLHIAATRVLQVRAEQKGKQANFYPHVDGSATYGHVQYNRHKINRLLGTHLPRNNVNFFEFGFDAEWEIDLFGKNKHEMNALKAKIESSEEDFGHVWVTLAAEVGKNYIELRGLQLRLDLLLKEIEAQKDTFQLTQDLVESGFTTTIDQRQAEEQLSILQSQKPQLELLIFKAIHRLSILLGYAPGDLFCELIDGPYELPCPPEQKPIGIPSELLRRRPDIRRAERDLAAASERVGSAIAELFPRLSLRGFLGDIGTLLTGGGFTWFAGSQLLVPIFNSRMIEQDITLNKIKTQEALYEYQKVVLSALEETENAIASFQHELEKNYFLEKARTASQDAYEQTMDLYEAGLKNYLDVLITHRTFISDENAYLQSQVDMLFYYIALYKSLGGGWENGQG